MSYTIAENNLSTAVSKFFEYISMNKSGSAVNTRNWYQGVSYKSDGTINTGYLPNWTYLSNEDNIFMKEIIKE